MIWFVKNKVTFQDIQLITTNSLFAMKDGMEKRHHFKFHAFSPLNKKRTVITHWVFESQRLMNHGCDVHIFTLRKSN